MLSKRHLLQFQVSSQPQSTTEEWLVEEPETGVSLGQILGKASNFALRVQNIISSIAGLASLVILVFYIVGISWKLFKIHRGVYVEEEPVFLKYK